MTQERTVVVTWKALNHFSDLYCIFNPIFLSQKAEVDNLDALYDQLTSVSRPLKIIIQGREHIMQEQDCSAQRVVDLLENAAEENESLQLEWE